MYNDFDEWFSKASQTLPQVRWVGKQDKILPKKDRKTVAIKFGPQLFGLISSKEHFVDAWVRHQCYQSKSPLFEILEENAPCRLYFDIEFEQDSAPDKDLLQMWLQNLLEKIKQSIVANGASFDKTERLLVSSDCRDSSTGKHKVSFHVTFPDIVFEDNHKSMNLFVHQCVLKEFNNCPEFSPEGKLAIDTKVYTKNRAWRVTWAGKGLDSVSCLVPWDVKKWMPASFSSVEEKAAWMNDSLCCMAHAPNDIFRPALIPSGRAPAAGSATAPVAASYHRLEISISGATESTTSAQIFARGTVPFLNQARSENYSTWRDVGFCFSTIFNGDQEGLDLFQLFSKRSSKYNSDSCSKIYKAGNGSIKLASLVRWLQCDHPPAYKALKVLLESSVVNSEKDLEHPANVDLPLPEGVQSRNVDWNFLKCKFADYKNEEDKHSPTNTEILEDVVRFF